ncbi:DUF3047 domain-containing protein [Herminiimonas glaciei]|uniref:DUF3047 domain-containing protein n=1 Tax=Herminiimonas glaciei TaxID=523788 RepID=A0ABW2IFP1_9BURK
MKLLSTLILLSLLTACAQLPKSGHSAADTPEGQILPFSVNASGGLPERWEPMIINRTKKLTEYKLVDDDGKTVLHARAVAAASGLMQKVDIDPLLESQLNWRWRISGLVQTANNSERGLEDSPARIILGFDGDKDSLPFADQIMFETARLLTGRDVPYATLMYIWGRKAPVDTIITNTRSNRVKMLVAETGASGVGDWHSFSRNIAADYEKAFGEKPGRLIAVGVLTDTDNTGETVEAWYGDISLSTPDKQAENVAVE